MYRDDVVTPNAEPELLAWHEAIAARPAVGLERFYWDQKTARLWFASLVIDGIVVEVLACLASSRTWPGFIIAADFNACVDPAQGKRIDCKTKNGRAHTVSYKPGGSVPPRWLALTTGFVGRDLLDEATHLVKVVRAGEFTYIRFADVHAVLADHIIQDTRRQWADAWTMIAPRLDG